MGYGKAPSQLSDGSSSSTETKCEKCMNCALETGAHIQSDYFHTDFTDE